MEFALSPDLLALRDEALKIGLAAAERAEVPEDTWITGHDRAFATELGARGWLGMTWPVEHGGGGRHFGGGGGGKLAALAPHLHLVRT